VIGSTCRQLSAAAATAIAGLAAHFGSTILGFEADLGALPPGLRVGPEVSLLSS